jgi:hypothetical protein
VIVGKQRKPDKKSIKLYGAYLQLIKNGNLRGEPNQLPRADPEKPMRRPDVLVAKT